MKQYDIIKPTGLTTPCKEIENTCSKAHMYKRCGFRPKHYIIPLDSGSGRTTLVEYMTAMYKAAGVLAFISGPDDFIEISFDGTLQQLKQAFAVIDSAAVYTNDYCNIIAMDISAIASHLGELQLSEFLSGCKRVCEYACVVFFVNSIPSRNEEKLLEKLCETVDNIKRLEVEPYTRDDMCALIIKTIAQHGVEIKHETVFHAVLTDMVSEFGITSVKNAIFIAGTLVRFADFSGFTPTLNENHLKSMISQWHSNTMNMKRSKLK